MVSRIVPDTRRANATFAMVWQQRAYAVTLGYLQDHRTSIEVFVSAAKTASDLEALARDAAIIMSFAMQYGAPLGALARAVSRGEGGAPASVIGAVLDGVAAFNASLEETDRLMAGGGK